MSTNNAQSGLKSVAPMQRKAVDSNAISYWTAYFSDSNYGKLWTRNIGKRVKAALTAEMTAKAHRQAEKTNSQLAPAPRIVSGSAAPLAHAITEAGVTLEGVFRGESIDAQGKSERIARVFKASFNHEGTLTSFRSVNAP